MFQKIAKRFLCACVHFAIGVILVFQVSSCGFSLSAEIPRGEGLACAMIDAGGGQTGLVELAINLNNNSKNNNSKNKNKESL